MNVAYSGWGAIWQSPTLIVHAPTPFCTSIVMKKTSNHNKYYRRFAPRWWKNGEPISAVIMAIVAKIDNIYKITAFLLL